jgi:hypothetical protein
MHCSSGFPTNSTSFHRMPVVSQIPPGDSAPPPRVSWVANLSHNRLNRISEKFQDLAYPAGVEPATYGLEGLANLY